MAQLAYALSGRERSSHSESSQLKQAQLSITAFAQRHRNVAARRLNISPRDIEIATPCTPLQEGLLFESMNNPKRPYFNDFRYLLGDVDLEQLRRAFEQLTAAVQMLRARYVQTDDGYVQAILKESSLPWHVNAKVVQDVDRLVSEERLYWIEHNQQNLVQPIKVLSAPTADGNVLVVFVHHALYDGIAWQLLLDHLARCYTKQSPPEYGPSFTDALPYGPLCPQENAQSFWQRRVEHFSPAPLPKLSGDHASSVSAATLRILNTTSLEAARKKLGVSHQACVQACFEVVLMHHYPETHTYGHVVSGRSIALDGADQVIGPLFNTLPHMIALNADDTWSAAMRQSHDANVAALPFQHTPLRDIRKWCKLTPSEQMFDVLFVFQHQARQDVASERELWKEMESEPHADYPLAVEVTLLLDGALELLAVSQSNVIDELSLNALLESLQKAISVASKDADRYITDAFSIPPTNGSQPARQHPKDQPDLNGVHDFTWTDKAFMLRDAIAQIAGLGTESVDEHSTIFSIGLDSIDAVKLASKAKRAGLSLPVSRILQAQTIPRMLDAAQATQASAGAEHSRGQLEMLETKLRRSLEGSLPDTSAVERILPATPSQEALIADMIRSDWQDYYNHDLLRLQPDIDMDKLRAAWQKVVDKSPILRTAFVQVSDPDVEVTFAQVVYQPGPLRFRDHVFDREADLDSLLQQITEDASSGSVGEPPLRLALATVGNERYLILSLAHAQYDGHSLALLHEDVRHAYHDTVFERPSYDTVIETSLAAANEEARDFWCNALADTTVSSFPRVHQVDHTAPVTHRAEKPSAVSASNARAFCQKHGVSIQALTQTCWALILAHYTRSLEVVYGVVLACRDNEEAEKILFPIMNTVPIRAALHGCKSDMLKYMQSSINDMRPYQQMPLRTIQAACSDNARKDTIEGGGSLFDTLFIYQHRPESAQDDAQPLYKSTGGSSSVEYSVAVEIEAVADQLLLRTACKDSVMDDDGTRQLLDRLDTVLSTMISSPEAPTISFAASELSICGLPWFQLPTHECKTGEAKPANESEGEHQDSPAMELSPNALVIRGALAHVAKVPAESIAPTASIESIGVDSISAIKVAALIRKQGVTLSVSEIIRAKTLAKMAGVAEAKLGSSQAVTTPSRDIVAGVLRELGLESAPSESAVENDNVEAVMPATAGQVYMLGLWQASQGQLFCPTFSYELQAAAIDVERIRQAWKTLVARHAILRTIFCATADEQVPVLQITLKDATNSFYEAEHPPKDMSTAQPMLALCVTKHETTYRLQLRIHHALYDAVSLPLLLQDFQHLLRDTRTPSLPAVTYEDFLALSVTQQARDASRDFWTHYLADIKALPGLVQPARVGAQKRVEIFKPALFTQAAELEMLARREGVTVQSLLFAAYAKVYATLATTAEDSSGAGDVVLGIYLANRSHLPDLDRLAAPTLNVVPLLVRAPGQQSLLDLAKQIQMDLQAIGEAPSSAGGLAEIERWTGVKVDTFVNFLKMPDQSDSDDGKILGAEEHDKLVLREAGEGKKTGYSRVTEAESGGEDLTLPEGLREMSVGNAYQVSLPSSLLRSYRVADFFLQFSLDLEATVADGSLDLGLFCPEAMLGLEAAEEVVDEMRVIFEKLVGKTMV